MFNVYWWSKRYIKNDEFENFGDGLVPYLLDKTTEEKYQWVNKWPKVFKIFKVSHYFIIGSIIRLANKKTIIWGAGIIKRDIKVAKCKVLAVRGPLTRQVLMEQGFFVPEIYGDPAILIALFFYNKKSTKKCKYGIIPHFKDYSEIEKLYNGQDNIKVIDLLSNNSEDVINQFLDCEYILTSSLHGIIVAHALNIPVLWMKAIGNIGGDDVKYYDYYYSVNINSPVCVDCVKYTNSELQNLFLLYKNKLNPNQKDFDSLLKGLIKTFPFKKSPNFTLSISKYFNDNI